ncbi:hypothetical protein, partial [Burkholderia stabilis]
VGRIDDRDGFQLRGQRPFTRDEVLRLFHACSCRPALALQRLRGSHALQSTRVGISALTRVPCFAVDPRQHFSAYAGPMLCGRPALALQRLPMAGPDFAINPRRRFSADTDPVQRRLSFGGRTSGTIIAPIVIRTPPVDWL